MRIFSQLSIMEQRRYLKYLRPSLLLQHRIGTNLSLSIHKIVSRPPPPPPRPARRRPETKTAASGVTFPGVRSSHRRLNIPAASLSGLRVKTEVIDIGPELGRRVPYTLHIQKHTCHYYDCGFGTAACFDRVESTAVAAATTTLQVDGRANQPHGRATFTSFSPAATHQSPRRTRLQHSLLTTHFTPAGLSTRRSSAKIKIYTSHTPRRVAEH